MQLHDCRGLSVTTDKTEAVDRFDEVTTGFLAHSKVTQAALCACLEADEELALAHAARGWFCLLLGQRRYKAPARESLAKARASQKARGTTSRESAFIEALADALDDKPIAAADRLSRHIEREPLDALAVKLDHMLKFMSGNSAGMRSSMEAVIPAWEEATPDCGYILGCYGFSLEETGDYRNAEIKGRRGVTIAPDDAWGWHAVAHVMEMQGRASEGVVWLKAFDDRLSRLNNFAFHVFWHRALFHLELGQIDQALDLYDNGIRADRTDDFRDIANAASLLMRLEFEKVDVGNRWEELADMSVSHVDDHTLAFADAHYMMALANAERRRAVGDMMTAVSEAGKGDGHGPSMMRAFSGPLMAGIAAFASGDYAGSHEALSMVRARLAAIGGSHAQRDVFEQMLIEAALRSGNRAAAQGLLHERLGRRPTNNWARRRLAAIEGPMHRGEGVTASAIA